MKVRSRELLRAYHENGDVRARDELITSHIPLVRALAVRYSGRGEHVEDLVQVGSIGLIKAVERFDMSREVEFTTYAIPTIIGEIKRHFRDKVWLVTVPRPLKEMYFLVTRLLESLTSELGRSPTIAELAAAAGVSEEATLEALEVGRAYAARTFAGGPDSDGGFETDPLESIPETDVRLETSEDRVVLAAGFQALDPRERLILHLRFFGGLTQAQIAAEVGISQMHVSRIIRKSLELLHAEMKEV